MKKILTLLLVLAVSLTLFACDNPSGGYLVEDVYEGDKLVISFFGIDLDSLQSQTNDTRIIMNYIEEKFQVKFKYISGTTSSWQTVLNQSIGGGDVPDIFFHNKVEPGYSSWLEDEYLFNYSEYLDDYPNLKASFARYDEKALKAYLGGDYYGYPIVMDSTTESDLINEHALYYRRDWYENLVNKNWTPSSGRALVDPEDPNFNYLNFYDLCEGFTNGDPNNNGKADTYGYALTSREDVYWWYPITSMFGVTYDGWHYSDAQQKWIPDCTSDEMKEAVWFMADLFDKGFINSNYATTCTQASMKNEFVNGEAGMMTFNATYPMGQGILDLMSSYITDNKQMSDVVRGMPVPTGKDGEKHMFGYANRYGFNSINKDVTENKKRKIMSIMDWMLSEEGQLVLNYGLEGIHYEKGSNGEIVSLLGNDQHGYPKTLYSSDVAPGIYRIKGLVSWSTEIPTFINYYDEQMQLLQAWDRSLLAPNPLAYCSVDPELSLMISSLKQEITKCYTGIVSKTNNTKREELWSKFVKTYNTSGSAYISAMNESAKNLGLK